ncbi:GH36-type glycosyl hydrolase domain-containing protein [Flavihumibacter sp.]|uniref:GH36-type glycosyl hydrolase domain-containing protein n=1 Tax=Flavihumibacter sp. TaxID=1913981 RepID=UPI002FC8B9EB|nr:cyclic beta 1-2 glucan synthetase [Flavihumibacter sediminis]
MKVNTSTVFDILSSLRIYFQGDHVIRHIGTDEPYRSDLYNSFQMDRHAKVVAGTHKLQKRKSSDKLLRRLDDNERTLLAVRNLLVEGIRSGKSITPGAEWLLDNFYLIEEQVVIARKHLPKGYSEGLPNLSTGASAGMPRVYDIVLEIISHSDGRVDFKSLSSFISSYQQVTVLTLGELWAIPIMLRLAVIENLRRVSGKIALDMVDHNLAEYWADKMIAAVQDDPGSLILVIADMARSKPVLDSPFVAGFTRKLQGKGPSLALPLSWMEQQLTALDMTSNDLVRQENQKQAADQVSVRNSIGTLRFLGSTDWREFVEALSSVEKVLREDQTSTYSLMDFATRDRYRHVVESISKGSDLSETAVAQKALELASLNHGVGVSSIRKQHVGYYLVDKGRKLTEQAAGMRYSIKEKLLNSAARMPVFIYLNSIVLISIVISVAMVYMAWENGYKDKWILLILGLVSLIGASQLSVSLVNWISTIWIKPEMLPRMDFSKGIPPEYRTLVVVPTMLSGKTYIEEMVEALEVRFLANRVEHLHYGLLTDFPDAKEATMPGDAELVEYASMLINDLNQKYNNTQYDTFFLFHRPRTWNAREKRWMGYERKRGKLSALNGLIRGRSQNEFSTITGDYHVLTNVKYVITLDSDTQLPRESVWKFIATMAHPLNHPILDPVKNRVIEGHGILQPRVASSIPSMAPSLYLRMQGSVSGIDPYTRVSSDVYQDLFNEGSFIGKGIYDVDVFDKVLDQVFPENRILSHDLLEGCYTRSGLLSDVLLYEDNPSRYHDDVKRHHRWIRGDWQIAAWILPFTPTKKGGLTKNKLSGLSKWKIFDNLRRSLVPMALLILLLIGWFVLPLPWFWTLAVTIMILLPVVVNAVWQLMHKPIDLTVKAHLTEVGASVNDALIRFVFNSTVLPYEAFKFTDAVLRTLWRLLITRKKLLEWTPSASSSRNNGNDLLGSYSIMFIAPLLALTCLALFLQYPSDALFIALPFLVLWTLAPAISWFLSQPEKEDSLELPEEQILFLQKAARKTWIYFEEFVTSRDNWLPPDNYQEHPVSVIAHRTSPTNMGLALLANLAAYDFGYISGGKLAIRCRNTLESMYKLERYQGHFYNWYDTISMLPLNPRYVSTVDSGNLAGHLLTLRQGLISLPSEKLIRRQEFLGLITTAMLMKEHSAAHQSSAVKKLLELLDTSAEQCSSLPDIKNNLGKIIEIIDAKILEETDTNNEFYKWLNRFSEQVNLIRNDLCAMVPWMSQMPIPEKFTSLVSLVDVPSLHSLIEAPIQFDNELKSYETAELSTSDENWLQNIRSLIQKGSHLAKERILLIEELSIRCEQLSTVEYDFLLDKSTSLLRIGYNVEEQRKDNSYYDLLASEARLGIFVGIAQGKLPQESWFSLGRLLTNSGGDPILLSWSGSMFEYLMPQLVMPSYDNTLLDQTSKATVKRQIEYGDQRDIPWGISESAYNMVDTNLNYQYRAFGVPGLGLKRGLEEDLVIAPYASMLALMVSPGKATSNLQQLSKDGFLGEFGFYEAIDYTASRLPRGKENIVIQSYMVHHQGMGFLAMAYVLLNKPMQQRFIAELRFQATLLLLQERIPRATLFYAHTADIIETHTATTDMQVRKLNTANTLIPEVQLLSNGRYQVMISNSGGGYSRWKDIAVTRWREDTTKDDRGIFCYIKDVYSGRFWSNTHQPTLQAGKGYEAVFSQGHVEFRRSDYGIHTKTEIVISPEDDTEMRRVKLTNRSQSVKVLEVTSYAEITMASQASDEAHPAFSNLFVQTEIKPENRAVFCTRRARSANETPPWMFHLMQVNGVTADSVSYETDRMRFIGRGNTLADPQAMHHDVLSGTDGSVLDPILSIRYRFSLKPNQSATIDMIYGICDTKIACEGLMHKYRDQHLKNRAFELSWTHSQVLLRQINATEADAQLYDRLAASVIYSNPDLRTDPAIIRSNLRGQSALWSHSISGDIPIVLLHIYDEEGIDLARQMVQAHAYWRLTGLSVDLVIWNDDHGSYRQVLQEEILGLISLESGGSPGYTKPGNIFVKAADQLSTEDRILFESVARVIIHSNKGSLAGQVNRHYKERSLPPLLEVKETEGVEMQQTMPLPNNLVAFNGTGGFTPDGKEYKIITDSNKQTPVPWVNVIANPDFGTVISETGSAYTWAINAHEYRITPWNNDPVSDVGGEAFYIRDEETGNFWSPSPFPVRGSMPYVTTHGFGYSIYEHLENGIFSEMLVFVDTVSPVKFIQLRIKNQSGRVRKLSTIGYLEIILGDLRSKTNMHILSEQETGSEALFFRNRYNTSFAERVSFFKVDVTKPGFTTDRSEFIGRNRNLQDPQALHQKKLSGKTGAGMDTCAALQAKFELLDGAEKEIVFLVGNEENSYAANALIEKFSSRESVIEAFQRSKDYWNDVVNAVQVNTPDSSLNLLANGWLTYQTLACRIFARSGFYQSGGAFGFRDQLQDVLSIIHTRPDLARRQILLSASRQFVEGDVQHWWHPPEGRGVRTRCSDDLLWLPYVVSKYLDATGDMELLTENAGYLESRHLNYGEDSSYDLPVSGIQHGPIYEHCVRAIKHSLKFGKHGLPFIGSGDWNDGMDQVGHHGIGESVWLAFFLYDILMKFEQVSIDHGDPDFASTCKVEAAKLQANIELAAWDGEWYKRAWFDDGTPLGSKENTECRIDAIAQSWSVLSGAGDKQRQLEAMSSLEKYLVKREMNLIQLLDPPFEGDGLNPGYIKGYVPGVRENGGQYSHAAVWALMAFAKLGQRNKVWEFFNMIQPIGHASNPAEVQVYKAEPYVMAADVYANEMHRGRGGWTWYTGSSGWLYQFILESFLGMRLRKDKLYFNPCFPAEWPDVSIKYKFKTSVYHINLFQKEGEGDSYAIADGRENMGNFINLVDDGNEHQVSIFVYDK